MDEEQFRRLARDKGYGEPARREFEPGLDRELHTHDHSALLLVLDGEFTLALETEATTHGPGGWCELEAGTVHTERTGPAGATVLLAAK